MTGRHNLAAATQLICGEDSGLADPQRWVVRQLRDGRFRGFKIGRNWFMTDADIDAAKRSLYPSPRPKPEPRPEPHKASVLDGLSERARRRLGSAS